MVDSLGTVEIGCYVVAILALFPVEEQAKSLRAAVACRMKERRNGAAAAGA
jgi:hypothetical protein